MLKKLLTLSLVAVMLSVTALASPGGVMLMDATYAEEAEEVTETFDNTKYEILKVAQTTDTTQTISKLTMGGTNDGYTSKTTRWYLVKVNVGKDWGSFTSIVSKFRMTAVKGKNYSYLTSLTKTDYDTAAAVVGTAVDNFLSEPSVVAADTEKMWKDGSNFSSNSSKQTLSLTLTEDLYTYSDGCLYFAFQSTSDNTTYPYAGLRVEDTSYFITTVTGTKVETPAVTDFSDAVITWENGAYTVKTATASGTAMLVAASFNGTTMVDAKVVTIDATTAQDGVIRGTISDLEAGTSVKVFLWANNTLVPAIGVSVF